IFRAEPSAAAPTSPARFCMTSLPVQVVDLNWGIRTFPYGDHEVSEIFLQEIQMSQKVSAGPAFVGLLGNQYGHRPLPRLIPEKQFEVLLSTLSKNPESVQQLQEWFRKDNNSVPPTYVLQPVTLFYSSGEMSPDNCQMSALLFVREIPRQRMKDGSKRLAKFMDLTADGLLDAEAQEFLTGLKSRLYATSKKILNLHCVELNSGSIDPKRKEHAQYLDSICQQFISQMTIRISEAEEFDWVVEEARQHTIMAAELSNSLQGRDGLLGKICLAMWESTLVHHGPLVVHGAAGMGKTTLLCKLAQEMQDVLEAKAVLVIRLLAANHPQRPNINHVLNSVCLQVCLACGLAPRPLMSVSSHLELQRLFQNILEKVSQQGNTLLLILDSLEQLADQHQAHQLRWLPTDVPPNVHLLVSMETTSEAFASMRLRLGTAGNVFEVERLSRDEGQQIMESHLQVAKRTLTREQKDAVLQSFYASGSPLHLQLILSAAKNWSSFTPPTELLLGFSSEEVMSQLLLKLEEKHGKELVGRALGCIVRGLMEAELRDVMSLDDDVISEVYRYSLPPTPSLIRMPPVLWARLKRDLRDQLEVQWTDGVAMLAFTSSSRLLSEVVKARYLTPERRGRTHRILAEYFLGRWSGRLKPVALPGLTLLLSDRKVPPQPLWFAPGLANVRKLQELPYHLLHAGLWEELRQEVVGSAEWLYCQSRVCGVSSLISDLDQCSQYMDCCETGLVHEALVLMKPSLDILSGHMDRSVFYSELLARLSSLASTSRTVIGQLCSQCDDWLQTCPEPVLIPRSSFLQQPGGALQHTLTAPHGGVLCLAVGAAVQLLVTGSAGGVVAVWSLLDKHLLQVLEGPSGGTKSSYGSLRGWSLKSGQQLFCIQEAGPAGSAPSSVSLQVSDQLLFVHTWMQVGGRSLTGFDVLKCFLLLCSGRERTLSLFRIGSDSVDGFLELQHDDEVLSACVSPDGRRVVSGAADQLIRVRTSYGSGFSSDPARFCPGSVSERLPVSAEVSCLELAQQKRLLLCGLRSGTVLIYPLALPQETLCIPPPEGLAPVLCLALGSQESLLAVAHWDTLRLFQVATRDGFPAVEGPLATAPLLHAPPSHMALLPHRRLLYGTAGGEVKLHDFGAGAGADLQPHSSGITCVTASNWGTHALVGSQDATLRLWALDPVALDHTMEYQGLFFQGVLCAAFADSDRFVFTGSQDQTVKVWDVASGKLLCVQFVYSPVVRMLTFRNGFVGLTLQGCVVQEAFRCPDRVDPDHNPLRNMKARYRVTSREKGGAGRSDLQGFDPAQISLNLVSMLSSKPSSACVLL
uniref:AAA+ ATPase domain-containing protein n=1 Tax=Poecilia mexicana TaxID=48701 RepID=A0A3B3WR46_9TELE